MSEDNTTPPYNDDVEAPIPQTKASRTLSMKFVGLIVVAVIGAFAIIVGVLLAMMNADSTNTTDATQLPQVNITREGFSPMTIKVQAGQSVTWTNRDTIAHRILADNGGVEATAGFDSEDPLETNDTYSYTFSTPGTYSYHDEKSPATYKGIVIVEQAK